MAAVSLVIDQKMSLRAAANAAGVSYETIRRWKSYCSGGVEGLYNLAGYPKAKRRDRMVDFDNLPDDPEELKRIIFDLKFEKDLTEAVVDVLKKDPGVDPRTLPNREKTMVIGALHRKSPQYSISFLIGSLRLAPASFYYHRKKMRKDRDEDIRQKVVAACKTHPMWGYRKIKVALRTEGQEAVNASEKRILRVMREEGLLVSRRRKSSRYSSYSSRFDTSVLPNVPLNEDGTHTFASPVPNALWVTDVTEFVLPNSQRVFLSAVLDCFDGALVSWKASLSEKAADLTDPSLEAACKTLSSEEHPVIHSDRGGQYHADSWKEICERYGLLRSMSRKGHSPDNARIEGFFGRLKMEFFDAYSWQGSNAKKFMQKLNAWLVYYNEKRPKQALDWKSPMQHRRDLGLVA